jgi:hypothetical protein
MLCNYIEPFVSKKVKHETNILLDTVSGVYGFYVNLTQS